MATRQTKSVKVVTTIDDAAVETLWQAGHAYVDTVATNDLAALNAAIDADISAHAVFAPAYAVAEAAWLKDNVGGKYSASRFVSTLNGRIQRLHEDESETIGVSDAQMKNIVAFGGDRAHHDEMVEAYVVVAAREGKTMSMPRYRKFLADWDEGYYNEDGTRTASGKAALAASTPVASSVRICALNIDANLEGQSDIASLAFVDALIADLENIRRGITARISDADKKLANKMVRNALDSKGNTVVALPALV